MSGALRAAWDWYERHYTLNVAVATLLFGLQLVHLVWLAGDVVATRATGDPLFHVGGPFAYLLVLVDWTEIPAILSVSLVYVYDFRRRVSWKPIVLLVAVNAQFLHIFWITDELLVRDVGSSTLPGWLAWTAIMIDYLELPVIADTARRVAGAVRAYGLVEVLRGRPVGA